MKLDKDFKQDIDREVKQGSYIGRKILTRVIFVIIIISIISAVSGFGYKIWRMNTDRIAFKSSITYNEGKLTELNDARLELIRTEDAVGKTAIANWVNVEFANYDESKIENNDLRVFLQDCRSGKY